MRLVYDLTDIHNRDKSDNGWLVTQAVVFTSMGVGIGTITDDLAPEFYARMRYKEVRGETMLLAGSEDVLSYAEWPKVKPGAYMLTPADVLANVGARMNVNNESRTAWVARMRDRGCVTPLIPPRTRRADIDRELDSYRQEYIEYIAENAVGVVVHFQRDLDGGEFVPWDEDPAPVVAAMKSQAPKYHYVQVTTVRMVPEWVAA